MGEDLVSMFNSTAERKYWISGKLKHYLAVEIQECFSTLSKKELKYPEKKHGCEKQLDNI